MKQNRTMQLLLTIFSYGLHFSILIFAPLEALARAGGGGSGDSRGGFFVYVLMGVLFGPIGLIAFAYFQWIDGRLKSRAAYIERALTEKFGDPRLCKKLKEAAQTNFMRVQVAWGRQDLRELDSYLEEPLFSSWKLQIEQMQAKKNEVNFLKGISIDHILIVDFLGEDQVDEFTVWITVDAVDETTRNGERFKNEQTCFEEFWCFSRASTGWKLKEVSQRGSWRRIVNSNQSSFHGELSDRQRRAKCALCLR